MASPWQKYRFSNEWDAEQIEQLDEMLEDIYMFLSQSPLGTSSEALDFSEVIDTGLLYGDLSQQIQSLTTVGSVYIAADGIPSALSAATGNALISGGVGAVPSFGKIGLTTHVSGILPVANGGTATSTVFTTGSVVFAGASGVYTEDNSGLFFDATNNRLGIGVASPTNAVDVRATSPIVGVYFSDSTGFAALRFFEGTTLQSSVQHIASNFGTASRRSDLELVTVLAGGDVVMRPNDTEMFRITPSGVITIGAATAPGAGTQTIVFGDGTAPSSMGSNTAALFGNDVSGTVKLFGITEAGVTGELTMNAAALTTGNIPFGGSTGLLTQDTNGAFYWDETTDRLGLGTTGPGGQLDMTATYTADQAFGFRCVAIHSTATAGTVYGAQFNTRMSHTTGTQNAIQTFFIQNYYRGTSASSPAVTSMVAVFARSALDSASPTGTITNARVIELDSVANQATGTPVVTITNAVGQFIRNQGAGTGTNGLTITNAMGLAIGEHTGPSGNLTNLLVGALSIPSGSWSIHNSSALNNYFAAPLYMGHTTTWGSGSNFISFADGTVPGTPASNTAAVYADDVSGTVNLFGINEAGETTQITGRTSAYTPTNVTTDRSYDANATTTDELADVLGTLIADLQARGILG